VTKNLNLQNDRQSGIRLGINTFLRSHLIVAFIAAGLFWQTYGIAKPTLSPRATTSENSGIENSSSSGITATPVLDGKTLLFRDSQGTLAVTAVSDDVIRVHFTKAKTFGRNDSYAVVDNGPVDVDPKVDVGPDSTTMQTPALKITVQRNPLRISFADLAGDSLDEDDPDHGMTFNDNGYSVSKRLAEDEHVYGFGEKNGQLDKRGWNLGGYNYVMWNTDTYMHDAATDPLYVSVPFFMTLRHGKTHGIFLDSTWRSFFDVGHDHPGLLTFGAAGGDLDYYFINGPDPKQVIERYTALTGRMPLPPLWSLGYNQCRYSYYPESRVRELAATFREKKIPADVIWLDIDYQDNYKPFTWNYDRFPDPKKMLSDLRAEHFRVVCIVDPHPKMQKGYAPYDEGIEGNYFVKNADGSVYQGPVWPSHAKDDPGPSVFPDFSNPAARKWWGQLYRGLMDDGIAGIWNDMDEPSVFDTPSGTMPLNVVFDNDGQPAAGDQMHNVYGQLMSRATFEGLSRLRPDARPFVLTRASFAGGQRYAALWTGDSTSDWSSLRQSLATLLGLGLSGFPFVGSDIGGFVGSPSAELYTRWIQFGVFSPFMRSHSDSGSPSKEPWMFGHSDEAINKHAIELRYELLPYIYNVMEQASETGVPALRPLLMDFPQDEHVAGIDDEFLFGDDLLAAPVLHEGAAQRDIYLPAGDWYDYWTGERIAGGQTIHVPVTLDSIPMYVRGGGFIFRQPVVQSTDEMPRNPLEVLVAPAKESQASFYEDDGHTLGYQDGAFMRRDFHQIQDGKKTMIMISRPEGSYRPAKRDLILQLWTDSKPGNVSLETEDKGWQKTALPELAANATTKAPSGWSFASGLLTVKCPDNFTAMKLTVEDNSSP
jgi:alpha-glucosidase